MSTTGRAAGEEISSIYFEMGRLDEARQWAQRALERRPDYAAARHWLKKVLAEQRHLG